MQDYTCTDQACEAHGCTWAVEIDEEGQPVDEADACCPACYGPARPVHVLAA